MLTLPINPSLTSGGVQCGLIWLTLLFVSTVMSVLFGVPLPAALAYAAYAALFVLLPGIVHYGMASRSPQPPLVFAAKAAVVGQCVEMTVGLLACMVGAQSPYVCLPVVYLLELLYWRRRIRASIEVGRHGPNVLSVAVGLGSALFLVFAASLFNFDAVVDQHFTWITAFSNVAVTQWPINEPFIMGVPLHYHYLFNIHVGMAAQTLGIPTILVGARLAIIFHAFLFVLMLHAFCQARFRVGWLGTLVAVQLLLTFGYSAVMWQHLHLATASIMYRVASTIVAFEVFLVMCDEILRQPSRETWRAGALVIFLMLVASGVRANLLPMMAGGIGLLLLAHLRQSRARAAYLGLLVALLVAIVAGAVFFLGLGGRESNGTALLTISPFNLTIAEVGSNPYAPLVETLLAQGLPAPLTAIAYLLVVAFGRTTFLLPGVVFALVANSGGTERNIRVMLGGVALAAISLLILIKSVVPQEIWAFYWYADISLALLGAAGLRALWARRTALPVLTGGSLVLSVALFFLQLWDFSSGFSQKLSATQFPTPAPVFRSDLEFGDLVRTLGQNAAAGDVLVTGGNTGDFDDRVLPAAVPGIQLYGSRAILSIYLSRVDVNPHIASRQWLVNDDLRDSAARATIHADVGSAHTLFLLWIGDTPPTDRAGLTPLGMWPTMSLWKVE